MDSLAYSKLVLDFKLVFAHCELFVGCKKAMESYMCALCQSLNEPDNILFGRNWQRVSRSCQAANIKVIMNGDKLLLPQ